MPAFTLTVTFNTLDEVREFLGAAVQTGSALVAAPAVVVECGALEGARQDDGTAPAAKKPRAKKVTAPATEAPSAPLAEATPEAAPAAVTPEPAAAPADGKPSTATQTEAPAQAAAPTQAEAQAAVERVFNAKGFQGAHMLLGQFGVQRLRELDASRYGELIAYADEMLAK
jgi:hypothetical protein